MTCETTVWTESATYWSDYLHDDNISMKNLLLCNGHVGLDIFLWLVDHYRDDIGLVITIGNDGIKQAAEDAGVSSLSVTTKHELHGAIRNSGQSYDLGFLIWWPWIIDAHLIGLPRHGGKHYNFWALVEEAPFGVSLHFVEDGIDCGDVVAQLPILYDWEDNGATLHAAASRAMTDLFKDAYPRIREGSVSRKPQDLTRGSFHRSSELEGASRIDLDSRYLARDLLNLLRARTFPGHPACWFEDDGQTFEVRVEIRRKNP